MDENEYKSTYRSVNELNCPFEKSILTRRCTCEYTLRFNLADREGAGCKSARAQPQCVDLLESLRHNARFALGLTQISGALPHAKEMKVQAGGLSGLQRILFAQASDTPVENIHGLLRAGLERFGELDNLPYQEINKSIVRYHARQRRRTR